MKFKIDSNDFSLILEGDIYKEDIGCMCDCIIKVSVMSNGFGAETSFDTDSAYLQKFEKDMLKLYETLSGNAQIGEDSHNGTYISFTGDNKGHIDIRGKLHSRLDDAGNLQTLIFENSFDQTCLTEFYNQCNKS